MDAKYFLAEEAGICNGLMSGKSSLERRLSRSNSSSSISTSLSISLSDKNTIPELSSFFNINETDRLISDQGLITPKERPSTSRRRVRDKSYYKGLIYLKGKEISDEIRKLQKETSLLKIDHSTYLPYKKKAELKAMELQRLQNTLANYNLVDDMLNRDVQLDEAKKELQNLRNENESKNKAVEKLFDLTKQQEVIVKELETDLSQEKYVSEILTTTMNIPLREKYLKLKRMEEKLQSTRVKQEKDLQDLKEERKKLESQSDQNKYLEEALKLLITLRQLENQREELFSEKTFLSASEEVEYLQKYRLECSDLLKGMTQESRDLESRIKDVGKELKNAENETSNPYTERSEKYAKLKKRENVMDDFLSSYCEQQLVFLTERQNQEEKVIALLKDISNKFSYFNPSLEQQKTGNSIPKQNTHNSAELKAQFLKLASDFNEINNLEKKLKDELKIVKNDIAVKEKEMPIFSEIEIVKEKINEREEELLKEISEIKKEKHAWEFILKDLKKRHEILGNKLNTNKTHITLSKLEKRWHSLEEENFSLNDAIQFKERNYLLVKEKVQKIYQEINKML